MFSVLISVYRKDDPVYFSEALGSLVRQLQYIREVVMVKDGPIGAELEAVIASYRDALPIREVPLPQNVGLARALNAGLAHCRSEWVFRFDADDLCLPGRAALQWAAISCGALDIVGGQIQECDPATLAVTGVRKVPCQPADIRRFLRRRNPFNHMTVCYRKSFIERIGGYPDIPLKEDYALWAKAVAAGARVANMPDVVVRARAGRDMVTRRGGIGYAKSEIALQWFLRKNGIKSTLASLADGLARAMVFVAPVSLRHIVFRRYLRQSA
ncbi:glycosyltransferase [Noviherbaspirillum pedocola]|uniref:Glycosyltransferase n=1 Tax=Noviherbaspirillum pedocola TaxID=2801341 RepID=A0A934T0S6_9BURK|nr:glycosyltransferase [Noviherbaspirillum pedocola]MBK4736712.1 glycosyltransferase [Noviherbaspirillum pedocola]